MPGTVRAAALAVFDHHATQTNALGALSTAMRFVAVIFAQYRR